MLSPSAAGFPERHVRLGSPYVPAGEPDHLRWNAERLLRPTKEPLHLFHPTGAYEASFVFWLVKSFVLIIYAGQDDIGGRPLICKKM